MFEREADWSNATTLICDVLRGSSTLAVETRHSGDSTDGRVAHFSSWAYEQTQAHGFVSDSAPRLFSIDHLRNTLGKMSEAENLFVYETSFDLHLGDVSEALSEFSSINVSVVKLTVGSVVLSWMLVSLDHPRDLIL
ncbi:MAG: hypothetical protein ABWY49_06060, partial [Rhizobium sp.]